MNFGMRSPIPKSPLFLEAFRYFILTRFSGKLGFLAWPRPCTGPRGQGGEDKNFHFSFTTEISNKKDESIQNFIFSSVF